MHKVLKFILVVPVFNESKRWNSTYWDEIARLPIDRIVFVNDGSTDNSVKLLKKVSSEKCEVIDLEKNVGKAEALRAGFRHALSGSVEDTAIGFIDSDGAFQIQDISRILTATQAAYESKKYQAIWSSRVKLLGTDIDRQPVRHYIGRVITTFLSAGIRAFPYDSQCGFKFFIMNQDNAQVLSQKFETRWFYDLEIWLRLINLHALNGKTYLVQEVPLSAWQDISGSKIKGFEMIRIVVELVKIRKKIKTELN